MTTALVIDDEPAICRCFQTLFAELDCQVQVAASAEEGLRLAARTPPDVVVLDVRLPGRDGLSALPELRQLTQAPIIVMTAHGSLSTAVSAVQKEAFEYLPKPFDLDHVTRIIKRALAESRSRTKSDSVPPNPQPQTDELVGNSLAMQSVFRQIAMAAQHDAPVLITGESGTGKELVARAIHRHSQRQNHSLVAVHLASLSEALLERELFGHTAGAFTGADQSQTGVIAQADRGSLFLDEIGETPASFQVKLLRTIETGEFYPVGSARPQSANFRLIAATNRSPDYLRTSPHFRTDFYYRLATIQIHLPALREHPEDIPDLASLFLRQVAGGETRQFSDEALAVLQQREYPGNVRELRNVVVRAASESPERLIAADAVAADSATVFSRPESSAASQLQRAARRWAEQALTTSQTAALQTATEIVEAELIQAALKQTGGNRSAASQLLGIHRETLRDKLTRHGLE